MAEEAHDSEALKEDTKDLEPDIESQITNAMRSRVAHFKAQSDSLTFEGVRRLLEKDMGLEELALDVHKRFIKQRLLECLEGGEDGEDSKNSMEAGEGNISSIRGEAAESPNEHMSKKDVKESCSEDEKMEDSPVLGLLTANKSTKSKSEASPDGERKEVPNDSAIKKAIRKRASYIKANSESITMAGLRRLLEEDLKLDKYALDPYKKLISGQLDEVIKSFEVSKPVTGVKKGSLKKSSHGAASKKVSREESSGSSDNGSDEEQEEEQEVKPRKKSVPKGKMQNSNKLTKRRRPEKETKVSSKKRKPAEKNAEDNIDAEDSGVVSEDGHSESSAEKPVKKKEVSTPTHGKRVEHLKSVIKSCGMSVPPSIYRKVKQVPENKREAHLIKELEEILSREGLSSNPSEKEIKEVKKRKERARELEGIDMSNIVSSTRRRSTTSFASPPKPKIPDDADDDAAAEDTESEEDEEGDDGDEDNDGDNGDDNSQSEEVDEEEDEDSD